MPEYQPYLIANFKTGIYRDQEPWLRPKDAWSNLTNMRVDNGVLEKVGGYSEFLDTGNGNPIMGFHKSSYNLKHSLLVADTKRLYRLYLTDESVVDLAGSDTFTGTDYHYFRFVTYNNKTVMTNWFDWLYTFDDSTDTLEQVSSEMVDSSGTGTGNHLNRAKYIFAWKSRIHLIGTVEDGVTYLNRHRWSDVNTLTFTGTNYTDASDAGISEAATGVVMVRGEPHVLFRSQIVPITATRDTTNPYYWDIQRSTNTIGSIAENFAQQWEDGAIILNQRNIEFYTGTQGQSVDVPELRDFIDEMGINSWHYITGSVTGDKKYLYLLFSKNTQNYPGLPNRMLRMNLQQGERSFSESTITMHSVFGHDGFNSPKWNKADLLWTGNDSASISEMDLDTTFQMRISPETYAGDVAGKVYKLDDGTDFDGDDITIEALSSRFNPYAQQGQMVRMGEVGFYVSNNDATFTVTFYKDTEETTPYATRTITCTTDSTRDKTWVTVNMKGEMGRFHRLKITHTESDNEPKIHAIQAFMAPGGPMRQ